MTFREKVLWVSVIAVLLIWGSYFLDLVTNLSAGRIEVAASFGGFLRSVVLIVVVEIVASVVLAIASPREANMPADIREREYALSAYRPAYFVLSVIVAATMLGTPALVHVAPHLLTGDPAMSIAIVIGNLMLAGLVLSSLTSDIWQIVRYRRSA
ncbi:hypothetical protein [Stakelama tenebrarum]|uniref:Uncharacterized protein n=1 Tax=Stakelama tenebrarum TaxID=2711215 RepID=A0A6G6Y940_9SPHN|nr:hypothetical protein [Sphingosinithalassobacter tenebrarum]QIG81228.1 hypothetical protein G5C33_16560 [Sphingosinithalassobacter tenebrarum]